MLRQGCSQPFVAVSGRIRSDNTGTGKLYAGRCIQANCTMSLLRAVPLEDDKGCDDSIFDKRCSAWLQENIPGSQRYTELLQQALQSFMQSAAYRQAAATARGPASRIDAALQRVSVESPEDQRKLEEVRCSLMSY